MIKSKHKFLIVFLIILFLFSLVAFRFRNGKVIKNAGTDFISSEVTLFRQDDEKWADDHLGTSSYTMKSSGCLTTCIATAISSEKGDNITPGELNQIFSYNNVYDSEGNIQWNALRNLYNVKIFDNVNEDDIHTCLISGHYPIVRVRVNGIGNFHYILIVGIKDGEYVCVDPLKDNLTTLSDYLNIVYAVRVVYSD